MLRFYKVIVLQISAPCPDQKNCLPKGEAAEDIDIEILSVGRKTHCRQMDLQQAQEGVSIDYLKLKMINYIKLRKYSSRPLYDPSFLLFQIMIPL